MKVQHSAAIKKFTDGSKARLNKTNCVKEDGKFLVFDITQQHSNKLLRSPKTPSWIFLLMRKAKVLMVMPLYGNMVILCM